jgi:hypothetical protein
VHPQGGFSRYDADLQFEEAWSISDWPAAIAAGESEDVFLDQRSTIPGSSFDLVSRFRRSGEHLLSWDSRLFVVDLVAEPGARVLALGGQEEPCDACRIAVFEATGAPVAEWTAPPHSLSMTVGPNGDVYVGHRSQPMGAISRFKMDGTQVGSQSATWVPVGMDFGPDGRLYVAGQYGSPRGHVTIHDEDGGFLSGWVVDARLEDLSVGPDGSVYVIVWLESDQRYEVRKYGATGQLLIRLVDIPGISSTPGPPTTTPTPTLIASMTPYASPSAAASVTVTPTVAQPTETPASPGPEVTPSATPELKKSLYLPATLADCELTNVVADGYNWDGVGTHTTFSIE